METYNCCLWAKTNPKPKTDREEKEGVNDCCCPLLCEYHIGDLKAFTKRDMDNNEMGSTYPKA